HLHRGARARAARSRPGSRARPRARARRGRDPRRGVICGSTTGTMQGRAGESTDGGFAPLARRGFTTDTVSAIKGMILDGRLRPGDQLPSERALSEALGVSRPTVREAIRSLQAMNIVETRHGAGTFVSSLSVEELLRPLQFALALSDFAMEHLFEVRLMLEPGAAELAAERASDDEIEELRECARRGG